MDMSTEEEATPIDISMTTSERVNKHWHLTDLDKICEYTIVVIKFSFHFRWLIFSIRLHWFLQMKNSQSLNRFAVIFKTLLTVVLRLKQGE